MGCGSMVFPMLVSFALKEDQHLWFLTMLAVAIFSALTIYLQFLFTRERVTEEGRADTETPAKSATLGEQLKAVTGDPHVVDRHGVLYAVPVERRDEERLHELLLQMGSGQHFLRHGGRTWVPPRACSASWALSRWPWLRSLWYLWPTSSVSVWSAAASCCWVPAGGIIAGLGGGNIVPVAIGVALKCLGSSPACYLILAMIADVIDHIEYRTGIRTDGLTMSIYSSLMVAATPICNSIFSAMLNGSGYNQAADVALGTAAQTASVQTAISVSYIWVETVCYIIGAVILILFWTVEKNLPEEQKAIKERSKK